MTRVVVDTNVIVSALLWEGKPLRILDAAREGKLTILTSSELMDELWDVVFRAKFEGIVARRKLSRDRIVEDGFLSLATRVDSRPIEGAVPNDPDDDAVIACAVAAQADYIISGDRHLLSLGEFQGIKICTAEHFLNVMMPNLPE